MNTQQLHIVIRIIYQKILVHYFPLHGVLILLFIESILNL